MASEFEKTIMEAAQRSVVKMFNEGNLVMPDYANRVKIPPEFVSQVYALIDWQAVLESLRPKINEFVATKITHAMTEELGNDVKRILSHEPTRLRLRMVVASELDQLKS